MSTGVESTAVFEARALTIGLSAACVQRFKAEDIDTLSRYAFGCSFQPGSNDESPLIDLIKRVLGRDPTISELSILRRLFYEAHAACIQDMRTRIERSDTDGPKKIPPAERASRLAIQQAKLSGIVISGDLEPSFGLLDRVCQQFDQDQLSYVGPDECGSRAQEILGIKKDPTLKIERDVQGHLKAREESPSEHTDVASDYKMRQAFTRRALAYDQANLIDYAIHEAWISHLFKLLHKDVPAGYSSVSMTQILRADREIFIRMADLTRSTIVPLLGARRPLDVAMEASTIHPDVAYLTLPLPLLQRQKGKGKGSGSNDDGPYTAPKPKAKQGKNKGKGKGGKEKGKSGPPEGCVPRLADGRNVCFGFNSSRGCAAPGVETGGRCRFGFHVCGKAGCHGNHSMTACTSA